MSKQHVRPGRNGKARRRSAAANPAPQQVWVMDNGGGHWDRIDEAAS
jgi:hypothetical protein